MTADIVERSIQPKVVVLHDYPHDPPSSLSGALEDNAKVIRGVVVSLCTDFISWCLFERVLWLPQ
jgi:hypothetical protein